MYLKRLEIHGFKSFASPTGFEFAPGVTCIVGPNGAGKTNVAEAVRWVLGEQATRIIRARKTEDVIFSGSAKRSALGMADVRLTLDNADGWLPLDFEEVVVSRRAFRSGDNEYYLNQSRVRLKDVTELFLKAEVGQNSYAFMGQGLVEQVLTLRPEERRSLIEEAADVRLHREKLDEARNRLAATRDNLGRVNLLVSELEPRLRQLERQADRAASHSRLSAELAQALRALFGRQWQDAHEALTAARAACDQRQEEFEGAQQQLQACEDGLSSLASAIDERRRDIAEREEAYRRLEEYRRDLERRITIDGERETMLADRRQDLEREAVSLREEQEGLASIVQQLDQRIASLGEQLTTARAPDAQTRELEAAAARLRKLRQALTEAERNAARARARVGEIEARAATLADELERTEGQLTSLQTTRREHLTGLKSWAQDFASRRQRCRELSPLAEQAGRVAQDGRTRLDEAQAAVVRRQDELRSVSLEVQAGEARLEAAQATAVELPPPDAGIKAVLAAGGLVPGEAPAPESRIEGLIGMVGELLQVPAGLERAVEAALADSLHAVVVEAQEDALAASELLISEDLGRATLIPLGDLRPVHPLRMMEERGVLGVASDLVRCDHRYRPLINSLLGRTIVVENLGIAKMLLRRGLGSVVTVDGVLLRPLGSVTAGSSKPVRQAMSHQRDVGSLPREIERKRAARDDATAALEAEERDLADAKQAYEKLAPEAERLSRELADAEDSLRSHRGRLTSPAARLAPLHARRYDAQQAITETERQIAAAREAIEAARREAEEHEAERERASKELEEQAAAREVLLRGSADRSTRIAALEEELSTFREQHAIQAASLERVERGLARRSELSSELDTELKTVKARLQATRQELEEKVREGRGAGEELAPARHSLEQLESRQRTINDELAAARTRSFETERARLDGEAGVRLRSEELDVLRERLAEEGFRPSDDGEVVPAEEEDRPPAWLTAEAGRPEDDLPPVGGGSDVDATALKERITQLRAGIRRLGPVNEQAETDFAETRERHDFLSGQLKDLSDAENSLQGAIRELEAIIKERFSTTYESVNAAFRRYFEAFFGGGQAELLLTEPDEYGMPGIDIIAQPPRKRVRTLNMLSGGERSLTALSLLFALLDTHPSPICVLDEVDAALDEANVGRFATSLRELAERTQFIIITHNRRTIEIADTIYGVSMGEDSITSVLSLRLSDISEN